MSYTKTNYQERNLIQKALLFIGHFLTLFCFLTTISSYFLQWVSSFKNKDRKPWYEFIRQLSDVVFYNRLKNHTKTLFVVTGFVAFIFMVQVKFVAFAFFLMVAIALRFSYLDQLELAKDLEERTYQSTGEDEEYFVPAVEEDVERCGAT